jgi:hypothetical protein
MGCTMNIIEPFPVTDIYVDDIGDVEMLGPNVRITYITWQHGEAVAVAKIVRPASSIVGKLRRIVEAKLSGLDEVPIDVMMFN